MHWLLFAQLWTSTPHTAPVLLEGNWQSCGDNERAADYCINGECQWTLHMGPRDEFGLYRYPGPEGEHQHLSDDNMLSPGIYASDSITHRGRINKTVLVLGVVVDIRQAGGSACDAFYVKVEQRQ